MLTFTISWLVSSRNGAGSRLRLKSLEEANYCRSVSHAADVEPHFLSAVKKSYVTKQAETAKKRLSRQ
jgi:hypothetical protein